MSGEKILYMDNRYSDKRYVERKERARQKRARQIVKRRMVILLTTVFLIVIGCVIFGSIFSSAHVSAEGQEVRYYKSIEIQKGDTLWDIAEEYASDIYYDSTQDYVDELKEINNLTSDTIHSGRHLIVVYYGQK